MATTLGVIANPVGVAFGQLIPALVVDEHGGMVALLVGSAVFATAACGLSVFFPDATQDLHAIVALQAQAARDPTVPEPVLRAPPNGVYAAKIAEQLAVLMHESKPDVRE